MVVTLIHSFSTLFIYSFIHGMLLSSCVRNPDIALFAKYLLLLLPTSASTNNNGVEPNSRRGILTGEIPLHITYLVPLYVTLYVNI